MALVGHAGGPSGSVAWVDGTRGDALPLPDRGIEFGDSLFETLPIIGGRIPWLELHLQRLCEGLARLDFPSAALDAAREGIQGALDAGGDGGVMRLTVTRGGGPRGYAPPVSPQPRVVIQCWPAAQVGQPALPPARLACSPIRLAWQPALAGIKHGNRLEQVLAGRECQRAGMDEMLMLDQDGNAISVISGNLFLLRGTELLTPALDRCGIAGTRRRLLLDEFAPALGLDCRETRLVEREVIDADAVLYCNSLRGYQPVGRYGDRCWSRHPVLDRLQTLYAERLQTCGA